MPVEYPIRAVAKLTGLTVDTLRAWERRYRAVTPERAARGRVYRDSDVRRLRLLRAAVENGHAIGQVASLSDAQLQALTTFPARTPQKPEPQPASVPLELRRLLEAIGSFDDEAVNLELSTLALLLSPTDLVFKVVLPLMRLTGENWENGTFEIAHEHLLSASVRNLLGGLVRMQRSGRRSARLLLTTPSGELHEFGILAAALLAVAERFQISYLGPNMPVSEILFAARRNTPQVVVLGIMQTNATTAVREEVNLLATELPPSTELWVGGTGAAFATAGLERGGTFVLEDLSAFERRLKSWEAADLRASR